MLVDNVFILPIQSAPRTGKHFLFWSAEFGFFAGNWPDGYAPGFWEKYKGAWYGAIDRRAATATHWTALPKIQKKLKADLALSTTTAYEVQKATALCRAVL